MDTENIGRKIKSRRAELGLTQKDLASRMHISSQLISKWETGESLPSLEYLSALCEVLDLSLSEMVGEKKKRKKLQLDRQTENKIVYSMMGFFGLVFLICFSLITAYSIVPAVNYDKYVSHIERTIENSLNRGFYNVEVAGYLDGEKETTKTFRGYQNEQGQFCYYDINKGTTIKDGIESNAVLKWDYQKPENINTLQDLFASQLQGSGKAEEVSLDDLKYIRKVGGGYYLEFSSNFFYNTLSNTQKKNYRLTDKIKGDVKIENGSFSSMQITIKYKDKPRNEHFTIQTVMIFKDEKPEINHRDIHLKEWKIQLNDMDIADFMSKASGQTARKTMTTQDFAWNLLNNDVYQNQNGECCFITADEIQYINTSSLTYSTKTYNISPTREEIGDYVIENGYIYSVDGNTVTLYNQDLSVKETITLNDTLSEVYLRNGYIYYWDFSTSPDYYDYFVRYNMDTKETKSISYNFYSCGRVKYNGKYAYWIADEGYYSYNSTKYDYVFDLENWAEYKKLGVKYVQFVDTQGNIYYTTTSYTTNTWYFNDANTTIYFNGYDLNNVISEHDGYVFIACEGENYLMLKNGAIVEKFSLYTQPKPTLHFGDYHCTVDDWKFYDANKNQFDFSTFVAGERYVYGSSQQIKAIIGDNILTYYSISADIKYLCVFNTADFTRPLYVIQVPFAKVLRFGTNTFLVTQTTSTAEYSIYLI